MKGEKQQNWQVAEPVQQYIMAYTISRHDMCLSGMTYQSTELASTALY